MMKQLVGILFLVLFSSFVSVSDTLPSDYVYICNGPKSKCYHRTPNCSGLNSCSPQIYKVTKEEAIQIYGRRKCKTCFKYNRGFTN